MGLRCSLLGHDYADPEVRRDREDRGDEVVVTVTEVRTCRRCGEVMVVSENTEVRSVATPEEAGFDEDEEGEQERDDPGDDASAADSPDTAEAAAGGAAGNAEETSAEEDDGVILDDEGSPDREPGEWPETDDSRVEPAPEERDETPDSPQDGGAEHADESGEAEDADSDEPDEPGDAVVDPGETEQTEILGDDAASTESEPELADGWPDADDDRGTGAESGSDDIGTGITRPSSSASGGDRFVCPECGHEASAESTSLRAGDICPECAAGYLAEQ